MALFLSEQIKKIILRRENPEDLNPSYVETTETVADESSEIHSAITPCIQDAVQSVTDTINLEEEIIHVSNAPTVESPIKHLVNDTGEKISVETVESVNDHQKLLVTHKIVENQVNVKKSSKIIKSSAFQLGSFVAENNIEDTPLSSQTKTATTILSGYKDSEFAPDDLLKLINPNKKAKGSTSKKKRKSAKVIATKAINVSTCSSIEDNLKLHSEEESQYSSINLVENDEGILTSSYCENTDGKNIIKKNLDKKDLQNTSYDVLSKLVLLNKNKEETNIPIPKSGQHTVDTENITSSDNSLLFSMLNQCNINNNRESRTNLTDMRTEESQIKSSGSNNKRKVSVSASSINKKKTLPVNNEKITLRVRYIAPEKIKREIQANSVTLESKMPQVHGRFISSQVVLEKRKFPYVPLIRYSIEQLEAIKAEINKQSRAEITCNMCGQHGKHLGVTQINNPSNLNDGRISFAKLFNVLTFLVETHPFLICKDCNVKATSLYNLYNYFLDKSTTFSRPKVPVNEVRSLESELVHIKRPRLKVRADENVVSTPEVSNDDIDVQFIETSEFENCTPQIGESVKTRHRICKPQHNLSEDLLHIENVQAKQQPTVKRKRTSPSQRKTPLFKKAANIATIATKRSRVSTSSSNKQKANASSYLNVLLEEPINDSDIAYNMVMGHSIFGSSLTSNCEKSQNIDSTASIPSENLGIPLPLDPSFLEQQKPNYAAWYNIARSVQSTKKNKNHGNQTEVISQPNTSSQIASTSEIPPQPLDETRLQFSPPKFYVEASTSDQSLPSLPSNVSLSNVIKTNWSQIGRNIKNNVEQNAVITLNNPSDEGAARMAIEFAESKKRDGSIRDDGVYVLLKKVASDTNQSKYFIIERSQLEKIRNALTNTKNMYYSCDLDTIEKRQNSNNEVNVNHTPLPQIRTDLKNWESWERSNANQLGANTGPSQVNPQSNENNYIRVRKDLQAHINDDSTLSNNINPEPSTLIRVRTDLQDQSSIAVESTNSQINIAKTITSPVLARVSPNVNISKPNELQTFIRVRKDLQDDSSSYRQTDSTSSVQQSSSESPNNDRESLYCNEIIDFIDDISQNVPSNSNLAIRDDTPQFINCNSTSQSLIRVRKDLQDSSVLQSVDVEANEASAEENDLLGFTAEEQITLNSIVQPPVGNMSGNIRNETQTNLPKCNNDITAEKTINTSAELQKSKGEDVLEDDDVVIGIDQNQMSILSERENPNPDCVGNFRLKLHGQNHNVASTSSNVNYLLENTGQVEQSSESGSGETTENPVIVIEDRCNEVENTMNRKESSENLNENRLLITQNIDYFIIVSANPVNNYQQNIQDPKRDNNAPAIVVADDVQEINKRAGDSNQTSDVVAENRDSEVPVITIDCENDNVPNLEDRSESNLSKKVIDTIETNESTTLIADTETNTRDSEKLSQELSELIGDTESLLMIDENGTEHSVCADTETNNSDDLEPTQGSSLTAASNNSTTIYTPFNARHVTEISTLFSCPICFERFHAQELQNHFIHAHIESSLNSIKCRNCDVMFRGDQGLLVWLLRDHVITKHLEIIAQTGLHLKTQCCNICKEEKFFGSKLEQYAHEDFAHRYVCKSCAFQTGFRLCMEGHLRNHIFKKILKSVPPTKDLSTIRQLFRNKCYRCYMCMKGFKTFESYRCHAVLKKCIYKQSNVAKYHKLTLENLSASIAKL